MYFALQNLNFPDSWIWQRTDTVDKRSLDVFVCVAQQDSDLQLLICEPHRLQSEGQAWLPGRQNLKHQMQSEENLEGNKNASVELQLWCLGLVGLLENFGLWIKIFMHFITISGRKVMPGFVLGVANCQDYSLLRFLLLLTNFPISGFNLSQTGEHLQWAEVHWSARWGWGDEQGKLSM